ncbi:TadE family protein [Agromyces sp. NPDC058484]|uniref:TadE family protein n=1 Tax=Agromyces sp. NPDC058484 TaxID=3346524 RepID=UPI00365CA9AA
MPRSKHSIEVASRWRCTRGLRALACEQGSASLEFLTVGIILLVPLVYLVLALAAVQAGALGVEGAARQAARVAVIAADQGASDAAVDRAVRVALADYGIDAGAASVTVRCDRADCLEPGARVSISVDARVELPLVPDFLAVTAVGSVPIEATATQTVSRFAGAAG